MPTNPTEAVEPTDCGAMPLPIPGSASTSLRQFCISTVPRLNNVQPFQQNMYSTPVYNSVTSKLSSRTMLVPPMVSMMSLSPCQSPPRTDHRAPYTNDQRLLQYVHSGVRASAATVKPTASVRSTGVPSPS